MKKITLFLILTIAIIANTQVFAQDTWKLFTEDFEDQIASTRWDAAEAGDANKINYAASYSALGMEAAPGGGEYCLKIEVNTDPDNGQASFVGLFPKGFSFKPPFTLTFDTWLNWEGSAGTTEFLYYGVGHAAAAAFPEDGFDFAFTGDNGSSRDVRLYKNGAEQKIDECETCVYADGTQNNIPGGIYAGSVVDVDPDTDGAYPGMQWLTVSVEASEEATIFYVNGIEWARMNEVATEGNILMGYMDIFSSVAPATNFALFDNVAVTRPVKANTSDNSINNAYVYPNPASGYMNIVVEENSKFELINLAGQTLISQNIEAGTTEINISNLNSGMYFSRITSESGKTQMLKVQIQ